MTSGATAKRTDLANAERLLALHGDDLRHVGAWRRWLAWDGRRWCLDDTGGALRYAQDTARSLCADALRACAAVNEQIAASSDVPPELRTRKKDADLDLAWASSSQNAKRLAATLEVAAPFRAFAVDHAALDADPWLLNVRNGTIDLRTGDLRPHRRGDLITKLAPVDFDPEAKCPTWEAFVDRAMGGALLVTYLQRIVGYALTGSVKEHILGFFFGGGANGKSTFLGTVHAMLGDYATPASRNLLFRGKGDRHATELATLHGRRFVTCSEIAAGQAFDESLVKDLTGGDPINCRRMREDEWSFEPTHKLFIAGNHKPIVRGDDEGIWRRLRLVPWTVTIPEDERDKALPEKLRAELPGILAWGVRGCLEWQRVGLGDPPAVLDATADYRRESDVLGQYFAERLVFAPDDREPRKALRADYTEWCAELGHEPVGARRFAEALQARGVGSCNIREGVRTLRGWKGVRFATAEDRAADAWGAARVAP